MSFDDFISTALTPGIGSLLGQSATFNPASGGSVPCRVSVEHDVLVQIDGYDAGVSTIGTTIEAFVSDVGVPKKGDSFTVTEFGTDNTYTVRQKETYDGVTVVVSVV